MSTKIMILLTASILCLLAVSAIMAAPDEPAAAYSIEWWAMDASGNSNGGIYALKGILGQDAAQTSSGGVYLLTGGFWNDTITSPYRIHLPLMRK
ncbi:hypothetical protein TFLX_05425 [Thermoflexales bacterium]|nr:hypothetical protein TFLX_05425 [Thermoflexales bacterium]